MKKLIFTFVVAMLAMRLPAPIPQPVMSIVYFPTNSTATLQVSNISGQTYRLAIQTSTNLSSTNWAEFTNLVFIGSAITFTNIPTTNSQMFFRCKLN
jgi:hypothetical protein